MAKYGELTWNETEAVINKLGGLDGVRRFLRDELVLKAAGLLKQVATAAVQAITTFSVTETFGAKKPTVKIGYLGDTFKKHFLGKTEQDIPACTLTAHDLIKDSLDVPILTELGDRAETSLAHLWHLLTRQAKGESGILLTNGCWNIFYIRDAKGTLWAVYAHWLACCGGWRVDVDPVGRPFRWDAGGRVFSHT